MSALEEQLNQQKAIMEQLQRMIEAMDAELKRMKAAQTAASEPEQEELPTARDFGAELPAPPEDYGSVPETAGAAKPSDKLTADVYGFVMADAIYDFKRVDPDWEDTLRVTTIPTQSGAYGNDGDFVFSVRQSRLGIRGGYGDDVTYILEGELFGVGSDQGQIAQINLLHYPRKHVMLGTEFIWGQREDISGNLGSDYRIQFSLKVDFDTGDLVRPK